MKFSKDSLMAEIKRMQSVSYGKTFNKFLDVIFEDLVVMTAEVNIKLGG